MNFYVLKSGSKGNSTIIEDRKSNTSILIDCGISKKCFIDSCRKLNLEIKNFKAIFITHEHSDHTKQLGIIVRAFSSFGVYPKIYISKKIVNSSNRIREDISNNAQQNLLHNKEYKIGGITITAFKTSHDSVFSCGFRFQTDNDSIGYVADTGKITHSMKKYLEYCRILAIESNHDKTMLINGEYPEDLKERILSDCGHLSNKTASELLKYVCWEGLEYVVALHISEENNTPIKAKTALKNSIIGLNHNAEVFVAGQDKIISFKDECTTNIQFAKVQAFNDNVVNSLTPSQKEIFDAVKNGKNIFITGNAGTGKSFLLEAISEWSKISGKNTIITAPTGIAALNIGGCTIHRALGIKPEETLKNNIKNWIPDELLICDLFIVDEISMCRMDLFDYLSKMLKKASKENNKNELCQLVVVGDFSQLPPVIANEKEALENKYNRNVDGAYAFLSNEWNSWKFKKYELKDVIRQNDKNFIDALNLCRDNQFEGVEWIESHCSDKPLKNSITLCGKKDDAKRINDEKLNNISSVEYEYEGVIEGDIKSSELPTEPTLHLKVGCRIMVLINSSIDTYMNGSLGHITQCNENSVLVKFDNGYTEELFEHSWEIKKPIVVDNKIKNTIVGTFTQLPIKLAYAITIHKSQGQTFEEVSLYPYCWENGQLYTALSRVKSVDKLYFYEKCKPKYLKTSDKLISKKYSNNKRRATVKDNWEIISPHYWTTEEENYIHAHPELTAKELGILFKVSKKSIEKKRSWLRKKYNEEYQIAQITEDWEINMPHKWTDEDVQYIIQNPQLSEKELAIKFKVNIKSIKSKIASIETNK